VIVPGLALAVVQLVRDATGRRDPEGGPAHRQPGIPAALARRRTAEIAAWIVGMLLAIWLIGFAGATLLVTLLYLRIGAGERWPISLALSAGGFLVVYGLFQRALGVPFPPGALVAWLGYG
jgi:hypothetical protein